jgi:hypothetical protein
MYAFVGSGKRFLRGASARALMSALNPKIVMMAVCAPLAIAAIAPSAAMADTFLDVNAGLTGWTTKGTTTVQSTTATSNYGGVPFTLTPAVGEQMVKITADGSSVNIGAVDALLGLSNGTAAAAISSGSTNFGLITKSFNLQAGTYTFGWAYAAGDYLPFSDGVFFSVGGQGVSQFNILARNGASSIVPGAAGYPVGTIILQSYGNTPWISASFNVSTAGSYQLGFGGFNALDTGLSPVLFVSSVIGTFTGTPVGSSGGTPTPPASNDIDTAASGGYNASQLGGTLNAVFAGGTLFFTTGGQTFAQSFVLGNSSTNTINLSGLSTTFSGNFTDQSNNGSLIFTNTGTGGVIILSGANTYTGATTIGNGAEINLTGSISNTSSVQIQNGGYLVIGNGGTLTAGGVTNAAGGRLFIAQGATLTDDMDNAGETENAGTSNAVVNTNSGTIINAATGTWNGEVRSNAGMLTNAGTWNGDIATSGTFANTGTLNGDLTNVGAAQISGTISGTVDNTGDLTVDGTTTTGQVSNNGTLTIANGGDLTANGLSNQLGGILTIAQGATLSDDMDNTGDVANSGTSNAIVNTNTGTIVNTAAGVWTGDVVSNAGTLTNAGIWNGDVANSGAFANTGTLSGNLSNTGSVALSGTVDGTVTNAATLAIAGTASATTISTSGTFANTGAFSGTLTVTGGTAANSGTITGPVFVSGGTFASTGTITGALTNAAAVEARGTINGAVSNSGTFALAGTLTGNGQAFANTGALTVGGNLFNGVGAVSNSAAGTISVGTLTDAGALSAASLSNAGAVHMANGRTGDGVHVTGVYTGTADSVLSFDVNLMTGQADHLTAGTLSGTSIVRINNVASGKTYLAAPIVLVSSAGGTGTLTADSDAGTTAALASQSLISYGFRNITGTSDWGIVSTLNTPALTSLTASLTSYVTAQNLNLADLPDEVFVRDGDYGVNQFLGHSWARTFTGDLSLTQDFTISDAYSMGAATEALSSQTGTQFGFDAGVYNIHGTGASLRVGLMAGSTDAKVSDETLAGAHIDIDAPNYGYYAALTHNGLRLSVQNRSEILKTDVTNPVLGLVGSPLKARSNTFSVALSKRFDVASVFVEPVIGAMTTRVDADTLDIPGNQGSVKIALLKSRLIRAGARVGTTLTTRNVVWTPYGELNAWQEGAGRSQTAYLPEQPSAPVWLAGSRAGTFGQALAGVTAQSRSNANLSGYVTADVRRGDALEGWTVRAGVKYRMK